MNSSPIVQEFLRRTSKSRALAERSAAIFPGGVTHDSRMQSPYGLFVERAAGSRKWDVDGNEYVDYSGGHGALLLGHNHPQVIEAVRKQLERGTHFGANHELETRWGELVQRLVPSAKRVRFTSSGTEATLLALRIARAHTGREKILRFAGHFHGWHDHMAFGVGSHFDGSPTPGVLSDVARNILLVSPNDWEGCRKIIQEEQNLAGVILEPTGASWGQVPIDPEFLKKLRQWTIESKVVLIFDEVISGFRCSPGGAQGAYGITPDLTTLAKILAGGLPGGAVVGSADIMNTLDPTESTRRGREKVPHQGTFNANPLSAAAGVATLEILESTDACQRACNYAAALRKDLNTVLREEGIPWVVYGTFSGFHIFTNPENLSLTPEEIESGQLDYKIFKNGISRDLTNKLKLGMLIHGVELFGWPGGPTSAVHTEADRQITANAFRETLKMLAREGSIPVSVG